MLFSVAIWIQAQAVRTAEDVRWNAAAVLITSSESADPCFLNGTGRSHHDPMMGSRQAMTSVRGKVPSHVVYMPFFLTPHVNVTTMSLGQRTNVSPT